MPISSVETEIINYLVEPNNIEATFDMQEVIPRALEKLQVKFWCVLKEQVERKMQASGIADWAVHFPDGQPNDWVSHPNYYLEIYPSDLEDDDSYCSLCVEQLGASVHGVQWPVAGGLYLATEERPFVDTSGYYLKKKLPKEVQAVCSVTPPGWPFDDKQFKNSGYIWYREFGRSLRGRSEIVQLAQGDALETELAETMVDLLSKQRPALKRANEALRRKK